MSERKLRNTLRLLRELVKALYRSLEHFEQALSRAYTEVGMEYTSIERGLLDEG